MLQRFQTRMGQIERNRNGGNTGRREPFVAQIAGRTKCQASRRQLLLELRHSPFQLTAGDVHAQIAYPAGQQLVVFESGPGWSRCRNAG